MLAVIAYYAQKSVFKATALKQILQTLFLRALAATSLDVKAAPEIQDSDVRLIDTALSALADVVYMYESELLAMVSLPNFGTSVCRRSSC